MRVDDRFVVHERRIIDRRLKPSALPGWARLQASDAVRAREEVEIASRERAALARVQRAEEESGAQFPDVTRIQTKTLS